MQEGRQKQKILRRDEQESISEREGTSQGSGAGNSLTPPGSPFQGRTPRRKTTDIDESLVKTTNGSRQTDSGVSENN